MIPTEHPVDRTIFSDPSGKTAQQAAQGPCGEGMALMQIAK
jgi:hypothetical protein